MTRHAIRMEVGCCYAPVPERLGGIYFKREMMRMEQLHPHLATSVVGKDKGGRNSSNLRRVRNTSDFPFFPALIMHFSSAFEYRFSPPTVPSPYTLETHT